MIELGVDEMTIVLQATAKTKDVMALEDWPMVAEAMISEFLARTGLEGLYGELTTEPRCPCGYTEALTLGEHGFYLAIAINPRQPLMGVCVRISAQALAYYIENVGEPYLLLQAAYAPDNYEMRLSRCDIAVDYIDEGIDVTAIYQGLVSGCIEVRREQIDRSTGVLQVRRAASKLTARAEKGEFPTFYLGSRKANVDALLRCYDKRREQIEQNGTRLEKALKSKDWVRFEASLRHGYANQFGGALLAVEDDGDFGTLIGSVFLQRYRFYDGTNLCAWTKALEDAISARSIRLFSSTSRNNDLAASLHYLAKGSGLTPLLYKAKLIWGDDAPKAICKWLRERIRDYEPNADCRRWLKKNARDYVKQYATVDEFLAAIPF